MNSLLDVLTHPGATTLASLSYHPNGMVNQVGHGNGVNDLYDEDPNAMARPAKISTTNVLGGADWISGIFEYDGAGNIKALRGMTEPVARPAPTRQQYTYDAFSNLQRIDLNGVTYQDLATSTSSNRLIAAGYDPAGNMTTWGGYSYGYDPLSAMATLSGGMLNTAYRYDADGERIAFREGATGPWTYSLRGLDGKVLREYSFNGSTWSWGKDVVYRSGQLLAAIDGAGTRHFTLDHLGSPRLITDASRAVVEYHAYWGYGQEIDTAAGTERMKFTGHERDNLGSAASLDYMHARYYNPTIGRFLAVDQGAASPQAPTSWNRYAYSAGNPVKYVDPDGGVAIAVVALPLAPVVVAAAVYLKAPSPIDCNRTNFQVMTAPIVEAFGNLFRAAARAPDDHQRQSDERLRDRALRERCRAHEERPGGRGGRDPNLSGRGPLQIPPGAELLLKFAVRSAAAWAALTGGNPDEAPSNSGTEPRVVPQDLGRAESPLTFVQWEEQWLRERFGQGPFIFVAPTPSVSPAGN